MLSVRGAVAHSRPCRDPIAPSYPPAFAPLDNGRNAQWNRERKAGGKGAFEWRATAPCGGGLERIRMHAELPTP